ncbi:MAG: HAD family hydrolase, partial [Actinomycetota bacterium]
MTARSHAPAGVLVDLDGTLVDSEPVWWEAQIEVMTSWGSSWGTPDHTHCLGGPLERVSGYMAERIGPQARPEEIGQQLLVAVEARIRSQRPRWQPGAVDFLRACRRAAIPTGLVTAAWRSLVDASLERMRVDIGAEPFDFVVTGDSVTAGKPHAEPYETAARAIGVATPDCLAVEDSPTGVQSALAAGCVVVAVPQGVRIDGSGVLIVD